MMGERQVDQAALFYEFWLERHVPASHLLRSIDRFVDLWEVRNHLAPRVRARRGRMTGSGVTRRVIVGERRITHCHLTRYDIVAAPRWTRSTCPKPSISARCS
jgi:hypothetical protein